MARKFPLFVFLLLMLSILCHADDNRFKLVIDAGHGGKDAGAKGKFSLEKDINLKTALVFGRYVEQNCPDVKVIYTRKTDVFVTLHGRADIANKNKADAFISIHTNALEAGRTARGFETYTMGMRRSDEKLGAAMRENAVIMIEDNYQQHYEGYDPHSPESTIMFEFINDKNMSKSVELARYVQNCVCSTAGRPDKGVRQDAFLVLRETSMPACLIELGFISTPDEERLLNDPNVIDKMARGIYQAFVKYKNKNWDGFSVPFDTSSDNGQTVAIPVPEDSLQVQGPVMKTHEPENLQEQTKLPETTSPQTENEPVFKVQILASDRVLKQDSPQLKGLANVESYEENHYIKYTYGSTTDYNEICRIRRSVLDKFPQAFIIAFKNGMKTDVSQAIREFKTNRNKK
ncbi:MAG: N-acetylmuramoyl-L-alanine amidase [Prevotella sp.]